MTTFVKLQHLVKSFDPGQPPAVAALDAELPRGKMIGLAGPDGAGKTTLIRLMAALLLPTEGSVTVGGFDTACQAEAVHQMIGYMPQKFGLYEDLSVQQNLVLYANLKGVFGQEREAAFEKLLSFTALKPFTERLAGALSGGMKQKLGLACSLLSKPALLLLDEPSVGVDPLSRRELWKMVKELLSEDITVVWSTAYLDEAEKCDEVLLMNEGKLLYQGPPQVITERVEGRTFKIIGLEGNKRSVLSKALQQSDVIDGIIQGTDVRIVTKTVDFKIPMEALEAGPNARLVPTPPRFEDAFVDILGGGPGGYSALAAEIPQKPLNLPGIVVADHLVKKFGNFTAANEITFQIKSGEIFGLLGPNGAGKSTTFKMMCGLLKPTAGHAYVKGLNLQVAPSQARSRIGYMAQKFSLYGNLSVFQNLDFFSGIYNLTGGIKRKAVGQMIEIFELEPYLNESADLLPLGYKQRLALSCSLMHLPDVLFLDEPTSGVDPITRREFWNHINGLVEKGITIMVTTHFMDEAEYCDRIGLVYRGRLIKVGTPDELKKLSQTSDNPHPTLEDAFIQLIEDYDKAHHA
ncbi:MAG: ATP-binding cassette domain-containing protein [Parachlamydia sp.]|jgi:ABC-2 type transport system ATP-binding protein|nr:ATP-binding cassette domain-containing protein [Parachlamydia sp.]